MGRSIALAFAWAGYRVSLVDLKSRSAADRDRLATEIDVELRASLAALVDLGALEAEQVSVLLSRIECVFESEASQALAAAQLVFEGVPETLEAKREAFAMLSAACRRDAILTSTTSSILVTELAPLVSSPERFLNIHWLNPAYLIPVVELSVRPVLTLQCSRGPAS